MPEYRAIGSLKNYRTIGIIILTENMKIKTKDFTPELSERIETILKAIK